MLKVIVASRNQTDNVLLEKKLEPVVKKLGDVRFFSARPANLPGMIDGEVQFTSL